MKTEQQPKDDIIVEGFCDIHWGNYPEDRKGTTGFVSTLSIRAIAGMSHRHTITALSTTVAEHVAACEAFMDAPAMRRILQV